MKPYLKVFRFFLIVLFISLRSSYVATIEIRKIKLEKKIEKKNYKKEPLKETQETKEEDVLIGSFNFISTPHFFPETGFNDKNHDLLGLKYNLTLINPLKILPGQLSLNSDSQLDRIAKNIFDNFNKFQNGIKLKAYNILTLSQRLTRSLESARILNKKLNKLFKLTNENVNIIKPFNLSIYNSTNIEESDVLEKSSANSIISYFIPKKYDTEIFPVHFKFNEVICRKVANNFEKFLNNETVKNSHKKLLEKIPFLNRLESESFDVTDSQFFKVSYNLKKQNENKSNEISREYTIKGLFINAYQNFIEMNNYFEFTMKINSEKDEESFRKKTLMKMQSNKKPPKDFEFLDKQENLNENKIKFLRNLIKKHKEILEIVNFDLFYIKNYSDDFIKLYSSEIFKFIMNVIYTYISPSNDEINKNLKNTILTNMFLKDFQLAGIYQILMQFKKEIDLNTNSFKTSQLPQINYGSVITMNVMHKKADVDHGNIINNFYVEIFFDFKKIKTIAISKLLKMNANYISNDPAFFSKACN